MTGLDTTMKISIKQRVGHPTSNGTYLNTVDGNERGFGAPAHQKYELNSSNGRMKALYRLIFY